MLSKKMLLLSALMLMPGLAQADLLAYYDFDGTVNDKSSNGYDLQLASGLSPVSYGGGANMNSGSSAVFNNNTAYFLNLALQGKSLSAFSVSLWFKTGVNDTDWTKNWAFLDFDRSHHFSLSLSASTGRLWLAHANDGLIYDPQSNRTELNDNQWHHAYVSYGVRNGLQMFIDGQLDAQFSYKGVLGTEGSEVRYGVVGDGSEATSIDGGRNNDYYDGRMDELAFWDHEGALDSFSLEAISSGEKTVGDIASVSTPLAFGAIGMLLLGVSGYRRR